MASPESKDPMSYVRGSFEVPLLDKCIGEVLADTANRYPEQDCLIARHQNQRYSYRQFNEQVDLAARGLLHAGVKRGDRVGIWSPNCAEWVIVQFASARIGAILVNINPANRAFELEHVLRQSECQMLLFCQRLSGHQLRCHAAGEIRRPRPSRVGSTTSRNLPDLATLIFLEVCSVSGTMSWSDFLSAGESVPVSELRRRTSELEIDDAVNIQYTSGTTGRPKGAMSSTATLPITVCWLRMPCDYVSDRDARMPGRGAYLCRDRGSDSPTQPAADCLEPALKRGGIARALRCAVTLPAELVESVGR